MACSSRRINQRHAIFMISCLSPFDAHRPDMGGMGGAPPEEPADEGPKIEEID